MLITTARTLDLKEQQSTKLETLEQSLHADDTSTREETKELYSALATGVKAGKLDQGKIDTALGTLENASKARVDKEVAALNDLHATLEPAQRRAVVSKIRERQGAREQQLAARMAARADAGRPDAGREEPSSAKRRMERLTRDLDLDAEQQRKVAALTAKDAPKTPPADARADAKKRLEALLSAFERDTFDAKKLDIPDAKTARTRAEQEVKLIAGLVPIVRPEQREKLAARVEQPGGRGDHAGAPGARGPQGHRGIPRHFAPSFGPDYDWFDDDDDEPADRDPARDPASSDAAAPSAP